MNREQRFRGRTVPVLLLAGLVISAVYFMSGSDLGGINEEKGRLSIITRFYGVTAEEIERSVTIPLEEALTGLAGIAELRAYSEFSLSRIDLKLNASVNMDNFMIEARERIDRSYAFISKQNPAIQKPHVVSSGSDQQAIFVAAFSGEDLGPEELRPFVENEIKPSFSRIKGLGEIEVSGGSLPEIHVSVDVDKAAAAGYGSDSIATFIREANIFRVAGKLDNGRQTLPVSLEGRIDSLEELKNLPISQAIRLNDIARAYYSSRDPENISRLNGRERVSLHIKSSADNIISISKRLREETDNWRALGWEVEIIYDRGSELEKSFKRIATALLIGMLFSSMILFLFSVRSLRILVLLSTQPLILVLSIGFLSMLGFSPDSWLLAGLTVGIGMVLDSALLVTDALDSSQQNISILARPLVSSTLSTLAALLPVLSITGELPGLKPLLAALSTMLAISLLVSLIFIPSFYRSRHSLLPHLFPRSHGRHLIHLLRIRRRILKLSNRIQRASSNGRKLQIFALSSLLPLAGLLCLFTLKMQLNMPSASPVIFARVELEEGENIDSADAKIRALCDLIEPQDGIESLQSISRRGGGSLTIRFNEKEASRDEIIAGLKSAGNTIPGGFLYIPEDDQSDILKLTISVTGAETAKLKKISREALSGILENDWAVEGVLHFKDDPPAFHYIPDREALTSAGVSAYAAAAFLRWNLQGPVADKWYFSGKERDLRVMAEGAETLSASSLGSLKLPGNSPGSYERLDQLGHFIRTTGSSRINRLNRQHSESFTIGCRSSDPMKLNNQIWHELKALALPEGYTFIPSSKLIDKQSLYHKMWIRFLLAVFLIFFLLSIERESLKQASLILLQLPFLLSIPLIIIRITGIELGTETILGLILISGMGINNGILIMDNIDYSVSKAVKIRFNGLFLTAVTSIGGLVPMLFTTESFFCFLSVVLISGLAGSLFVSILIFPILISWILNFE